MTARSRSIVAVFAAFLLATSQQSEGKTKEAAAYDMNNDGLFSGAELRRCLRDLNSIAIAEIDTNGNGRVEQAEVSNADVLLSGKLKAIEGQVSGYGEAPKEVTVFIKYCETADKKIHEAKPKTLLQEYGFLVRSVTETIDFGEDAKKASKAKAASFAYTNNDAKETTNLTISGSIMRPIEFSNAPRFRLVPSLVFNKVKNAPEPTGKDTDSLAFRVTSSWQVPVHDTGPVEHLYFNVIPGYTTDSHFDADIVSLEFQAIPVATRWAINGTQGLGRAVNFRLRPVLHYEVGDVRDSGSDGALRSNSDFSRLGIKLGIDLWPRNSSAFTTSFHYEYLAEQSGELRDRKLFTSEVNINLDKAGTYTLQLKYVNGDTSVKLEDEEMWSIGLGIRF